VCGSTKSASKSIHTSQSYASHISRMSWSLRKRLDRVACRHEASLLEPPLLLTSAPSPAPSPLLLASPSTVNPLVCKSTFKSYWCSAQYRALLSMEKGYEKAVLDEPYSESNHNK